MTRKRADIVLVELGHYDSRAQAQAAIAAGLVSVDGVPLAKASAGITPGAAIVAGRPHPYVSRGGVKLAAALDAFGIDPAGRRCLDIGASTGGFTDVLLRRGAAHVMAVDTGRDQLHDTIRSDPRVTAREATDIRDLTAEDVAGQDRNPPDLAVIDVSFIPLALVLPAAARLLAPRGEIVALVKPQFEVGRAHLKKGIVRDEAVRLAACVRVAETLAGLGFRVEGPIPSPIAGGDGNVEYLIAGRRG